MRNRVLVLAGIVIGGAALVALCPSRVDAVGTVTTSQADIVVAREPSANAPASVTPLEKLAQRDLAASPEDAPAVIQVVAALAGTDRPLAGATLARWLRTELGRDTRDAQGNVVSLVEALGATGGDAAVVALVDVLERGGDDLALQTLAAQELLPLGDARGQAAAARYAARLRVLPAPRTDFERQLRAEGLAAANGKPRE